MRVSTPAEEADAVPASQEQSLVALSFARRMQHMLLICASAWTVFALLYAARGHWKSVAVDAAAAVLSLLLRQLATADLPNPRLWAHVAIGINFVALIVASLLSGQSASMSLWFLSAVPLFAIWQLGTRAALGWAAAVWTALVAQFAVARHVPLPAEFVAFGFEVTFGQIVLTAVGLFFGIASHAVAERHLVMLRTRERELALQAEALRQARRELERAGAERAKLLELVGGARGASGLRVLVAEDNTVNQEVAEIMLDILGCHAKIVDNGRLAVEAAERERYDVALLDVHMPEMDGVEAARRLRGIRLIGVTASADEERRRQMAEAGVESFIQKPLVLEELAAVLRVPVPAMPARPVVEEVAPSSTPDNPLEGIREAFAHAPHRYAALIEGHLANNSVLQARVEAALAGGGGAELKMAAHSLKGSSSQFGATEVAELCARIEKAADDPSEAAGLVTQLREAMRQADRRLQEELARTQV